tara:strand:- start:1595 stop:1912 length:318 start_codon:yes stop_codon:yes gene_type:complete
MSLRKFERVSTNDSTLSRIQERIEDAFVPVLSASILNGKIIKDVNLASGTTAKISHGLGRNLSGWIVVGKNAAQHVYDLQSSNENKDKFLHLTAGGTVTVSLWVF